MIEIIMVVVVVIITEESFHSSETLSPFWTRVRWGARSKVRDWGCKFGLGLMVWVTESLGHFAACCLVFCFPPDLAGKPCPCRADAWLEEQAGCGCAWSRGLGGTGTTTSIWCTEAANERKGRRGWVEEKIPKILG